MVKWNEQGTGLLAWCCLVQGRTLGKGSLYAMHWSSVTLSAILGKLVSSVLQL